MRVLQRNKRTVWLSKPTRKELVDEDGYGTGEFINTWSDPIKLLINVSHPTGDATSSPFGTNANYDLTLVDDNNEQDIEEGNRIWFTSEKPDVDSVHHCYEVERVSPSLLFWSFGLKKVNGK